MGSTRWHQQRKIAHDAGRIHADGGEDKFALHAAKGDDVAEAYRKGYKEREREIAEQASAFNHPLNEIVRRTDALASRAEDSDVRELADIVNDLARHLADKEGI